MEPAWAFYRRSKSDQELSIPDQRKVCEKSAAERGCYIKIEFKSAKEAASGLSIEHDPEFKRMVSLAEQGNHGVRYLYIYDVSRFGRMPGDVKTYWEVRFRRAGIEVIYPAESFSGDGSFGDRIHRLVSHEKAHEYSMRLRVDTIRGCKSHAALGHSCGGSAPYGFDRLLIGPDGKPIRIMKRGERKAIKTDRIVRTPGDPEKRAVVVWMFQSKDAGNGVDGIAKELNRREVPSPYGGKWCKTTVREILQNPVYTGTHIYNKRDYHDRSEIDGKIRHRRRKPEEWVVKENAYEALVPQELFDRVQASFRKYKPRDGRRYDSPHILSGRIDCAHCGHRYCGQYHHHKGKRTRYYECGAYNAKGSAVCESFAIKADILESFAWSEIAKRLKARPTRQDLRLRLSAMLEQLRGGGADARVKDLTSALASIQPQINNITAALAERPSSTALGEKLDSLERERARVQQELEKVKSQLPDETFDDEQAVDEMLESLDNVSRLLEKSSLAELKAVARTFIAKITIHQDQRQARFHFFKLPGLRKSFVDFEKSAPPARPVRESFPGKSFAGPMGPANYPNQIGCGGWI